MPYANIEKRRERARERDAMKRSGNWIPKPPVRQADEIQCSHCSKPFYRPPANRLNRGFNQYCSRTCMAAAYVGRNVGEKSPRWKGVETRNCDGCGSEVTRPPCAWNNRNLTFCNMECFGVWKSKNWTGEDNPCWRGGHPPYYGPNWIRQSREARKRDNHKCQFCGVEESLLRRALNVHHIVPIRMYGADFHTANKLSNLISLCDKCHTFLEKFCLNGEVKDWHSLLSLGQTHQTLMTDL